MGCAEGVNKLTLVPGIDGVSVESAVELIRSLSTTNGRFCAYVRIAPTYSPSKPIKNS